MKYYRVYHMENGYRVYKAKSKKEVIEKEKKYGDKISHISKTIKIDYDHNIFKVI